MSSAAARLMQFVFVYGTLKRGQPNHHWITTVDNGTASFIGCGRTTQKFPLVIATRYNVPFLLDLPGTGRIVHGEVYAVDDAKLAHLDVLEEYPSLYDRQLHDIELVLSDNTTDCAAAATASAQQVTATTTQSGQSSNTSNSSTAAIAATQRCWVYKMQHFPDEMLRKPWLESYADTPEQPYLESDEDSVSRDDFAAP